MVFNIVRNIPRRDKDHDKVIARQKHGHEE
jgi:hypothetical protein